MIGQSLYYFPIIEQELEKAGLPLELKFMAVVESALQPTAVSPAGAVGLWQFMLTTGRHYGLEISSMVDERRDPVASTRAACAYLKDLYDIYGDWTLALASYNFGPGNVNKALKRAGGTASTYWDIYPYLPKATRDYIPAFVGLTYAYHYYKDHHVKPNPPTLPIATDTVTISRNLHLQQVATTLEIPLELLQNLTTVQTRYYSRGHPHLSISTAPTRNLTFFGTRTRDLCKRLSLFRHPFEFGRIDQTASACSSQNCNLQSTQGGYAGSYCIKIWRFCFPTDEMEPNQKRKSSPNRTNATNCQAMSSNQETIVAIASGTGGAIALIRISGPDAIAIADRIFSGVSHKSLTQSKGFTLHYGYIRNELGETIDDVILSLFKAPHSYTGEDMIEVTCHGSTYIQQEILRLFIQNGAGWLKEESLR